MVAGIAAARPMAVAASASAMPGATIARLVSLDSAMAKNAAMMPQTVPNRPMKGATEEITARFGSPPSRRARSVWAARRMLSATRVRASPTLSPGMVCAAARRPAAMIGSRRSVEGCNTSLRAARTAWLSRRMHQMPSMISTQHQIEAASSVNRTVLATGPAWKNSPIGVSEGVRCSMVGPLLEQTNALDAGRQDQPFKAEVGIARRAGGNVVHQNGANLAAVAVDLECLDHGLDAEHRAHLGHQPALDDALAAEHAEIELQGFDRALALVFDHERQPAAVLHAFRRVQLQADRVVWRRQCGRGKQQEHCQQTSQMAHHDPPQLPRWKRFYTGMAPLARVNSAFRHRWLRSLER